jgi:hypothetical protein
MSTAATLIGPLPVTRLVLPKVRDWAKTGDAVPRKAQRTPSTATKRFFLIRAKTDMSLFYQNRGRMAKN